MFNVINVTPVSVSFESDYNRAYYYDKSYDVYVDGKLYRKDENRNIFTVFDLEPDHEYKIRIKDQSIMVKTLPTNNIYNVLDYGVVTDGETLNTEKIQALLDKCDGDLIVFPAGKYYTGPLNIRSNTTIYFKKDAELIGSTNRADYPIIKAYNEDHTAVNASWEGEPEDCFMSLLTSFDSENITIVGDGTINGNADKADWWIDHRVKRGAWRGNNFFVNRCKNVKLIGLSVINSPCWNVHPFYSEDLEFIDLQLTSVYDSPNTDGFDPESCKNIKLLGTKIFVGDDCVAIKSGKKIMADNFYKPCENILIRNCFMGDGHGGVVFGSESSCGIKNVTVHRCIFKNTDRGLRIKTKRGRGNKAVVEDVYFDHILMDGVYSCLVINMYYYLSYEKYDDYADSKEYREFCDLTPVVGEFVFQNIACIDTKVCAGYFYGLPESKIAKITLNSINVTFDENYKEYVEPAMIYECEKINNGGFYFYNVDKVEMNEVYVERDKIETAEIHNV